MEKLKLTISLQIEVEENGDEEALEGLKRMVESAHEEAASYLIKKFGASEATIKTELRRRRNG